MFFINKSDNSKRFYLAIIIFILLFITSLNNKLYAKTFKITEIEISEQFNLNFNKKTVFDKAFKSAFTKLTSMVLTSEDKLKLKNINIIEIKRLIDSFDVNDEKFINNNYSAKFNVNFDKDKTMKFFDKKNIFPSIPKKIDVLFVPVMIDINNNNLTMFNENPIYKNWNKDLESFHLINYILPTEDIEDRNFLKNNLEYIEDYDFKEIIQKYDLESHLINIIYKDGNSLKVLSKIKLNDDYKIFNKNYDAVNFNDEKLFNEFVNNLKINYEDVWKNLNLINTSIKLPLTISLSSKKNNKIRLFEETLLDLDLVYDFYIISFNNEHIFYKVIYNGTPNKFLDEIKKKNFRVNKESQLWKIQ